MIWCIIDRENGLILKVGFDGRILRAFSEEILLELS